MSGYEMYLYIRSLCFVGFFIMILKVSDDECLPLDDVRALIMIMMIMLLMDLVAVIGEQKKTKILIQNIYLWGFYI